MKHSSVLHLRVTERNLEKAWNVNVPPPKELEVISYLQAGHQADKTQTRKR